MIIGIDPGERGALAALNDDGSIAEVIDMPKLITGKKQGTKKIKGISTKYTYDTYTVDGRELYAFLYKYAPDHMVLEKVGAMPKQGVVSSFNFGKSYGIALGVCTAYLGRMPHLVTPQKWKSYAGIIALDKDASRRLAIKLWPSLGESILRLKKDVDKADALLIARYGLALIEVNGKLT